MGEKSRRKGPAPCHADGKLARTCDHPYVPWGFTPASRAPTAWVGASLSCMGLSAASQAPGLCRDEQSSRISVPHLSGAPILLPDLKGTQLSNFQVYPDVRGELTDSEAPRVTRCVHGNRSTALQSFDITLLQNHLPCPTNRKEKTREAPQKRRGEVPQKKSSSL
ncbi:putative uncharacterized protein LINC02693 isoform X3 [Symphalangus syndactylus]|uniref:putative uncharacterized protein LINC02693 isoform X3 n=1 Tax=Symphalangus syndactylus TaxID=9590 RepID=UPI002442F892|nr:putative uncharacterized protein LINC02693 isoform X2 [Symphalangus syndactylus]